MPLRKLQWFGNTPTRSQKSCVRRCILQHSSETTEDYEIFGMLHESTECNNVPFMYKNRLFLATYRQDFVIALEDTSLNIKVLIDLWDCKPVQYHQLPFASEFEMWVKGL